jgi:regulator of protease activity HflC (stomatin/prohibitin superfamily)
MTDLVRLLVEIWGYIWPLKIVWQWERGAFYMEGRYWRDVGPGCYPIIPFLWEIKTEGVVSQTHVTPLQTITTKDGGTLTFSASIKLRVVSLGRAFGEVLNWDETALEDASAALADTLSDVDIPKLDPENRRRLLRTCTAALNKELNVYGLEIDRFRFNNYVRNMRVYRLFSDQTQVVK